MTYEQRLARHAAGLQWEDIPETAQEAVSTMLIDTAGVILAGLASKECQNLVNRFEAWGGAEESTVAGCRRKMPAPAAAYLGGVLAHWWEWDDTHDESAVHASAVIFPTLLAVAEAVGLDEGEEAGKEFVAATVAAFDIACQIGASLEPHYHLGVMATGVPGHIGAVAGAARLLGMDEEGITSAMGLAAEQAGLSRQPLNDRVNGKNVLCGISASQAAQSAYSAQAGIQGSENFLSGRYGLNVLFAEGKADFEKGLSGIGTRFSVAETSVKPYPSCRSTHPGLDLTFDMLSEDPDLRHRIRSVEVSTSKVVHALCGRPFSPGNDPRVAAQFSIPYTQSVALKRGRVGLADFDPAKVVSNSDVLEMAKSVTVTPWDEVVPGATWWQPHRVRLQLDDGSVREREVVALRGSQERPLLPEEHLAKLEEAGRFALDRENLHGLAEDARNVPVQGIGNLTKRLRAARRMH